MFRQPPFLHLSRLTLNRLLIAIVFIALFAMATRYPADSDTWWHLLAGKTMWQSKSILTHDIFSYTKNGTAWINHSWLGQIFWFALLKFGGWPAIGLGLAAIVTASFALVWRTAWGNVYIKAFSVILGAIASSIVWAARPQMLSFFAAALTAFLLARFKRGQGKLLPWLPLIVLVWVNTHGGFAIAFILLACYLIGEAFNTLFGDDDSAAKLTSAQWKHLLLTTLICLAVVPLNPYTWRMWLYPFNTIGIGVLRDFIAEWQSPNFHQPIVQAFLALVLALVAAIARSGKRIDWTDLALVGAWLTLSLFAVRNVAIFAVICTPILAKYATAALETQFGPLRLGQNRLLPRPFYVVNWIVLGLLALGAAGQAISVFSPAAIRQAEAERFPAEAVAFIQQTSPPGPMFNSYNIGGYLMYHLWPDYSVFVDGRTDLYDDDFLRTYLQTANALPGWEETFSEYDIRLAVAENDVPLSMALARQSGWESIYMNTHTTIFINTP